MHSRRLPTQLVALGLAGLLLVSTGTACAAVVVDASSSAKKTTSGTLSWTHTVGAGTNREIIVGVVSDGTVNLPSSVTWNGSALTLIGTVQNATYGDSDKNAKVSVWALKAPTSGTHTISVTLASGSAFVAGATSFTGVDQTTPYSGFTTTTGTSGVTTLTEPAGSGLFLDFIGVYGGGSSVTPVSQTLRWNQATGNQDNDAIGGSSSKTTGGTTSWTLGSSAAWAVAGLWLNASSSGASGFKITTGSYGLFCLGQTVTITSVDGSGNAVTGYSGTANLTTTTARGTWTKTAGSGTLTDAVPDDGAAAYVWNSADSSATFSLSYQAGPAVVTVNAVDSVTASLHDDATQGAITFSPSGFTVTSSPFSNPVGGVPAFASPQIAGNNFNIYITAYGQNPTNATCGIITSYGGAKSLKFWSAYLNPVTGTVAPTINATTIATIEASAAAQSVTFTSGQALVNAKYNDAGSISLAMKDDTTGNPSLPMGIRGSTGPFVSVPANFVVTNIKRTSDNFANPAASIAAGVVFITAGQSFTATITAVESGGATTANYGRESTPESVAFTSTLVLPVTGNAPAVSGTAGVFTNGVATGTAFAWPEVGIIKLVPHVADGNYLGAGDIVGNATGNVGRFVPNSFAVALNTPVFGTACNAGGFTYLGQPFMYTVAPVITVTALAFGGATTHNYSGSLFRLTNSSLTGRTYTPTPANPALDSSGLPATASDPTIVDLGGGQGTLTFSAGIGLSFVRGGAVVPFAANIALAVNVIDLDTIAAANPVTFGASSGIAFSPAATQYYGRLTLRNRVGSELLDLPMSLTTEYYASAALGFTTNTGDSCTVAPTLAFSNYQANLAAGETCVRDTGSPGLSGAGCAMASGMYRASALMGDFNLVLAAPGSGNSGAVTATATAPNWLKYLWSATGVPSNPAGLAVFGLFPGPVSRIYQREVY